MQTVSISVDTKHVPKTAKKKKKNAAPAPALGHFASHDLTADNPTRHSEFASPGDCDARPPLLISMQTFASEDRACYVTRRKGRRNEYANWNFISLSNFFYFFFTLKLRIETLRPKEKTCAKDGGGSYCWEKWRQNSFFYKGKVKSWASKPFRRHEKQWNTL